MRLSSMYRSGDVQVIEADVVTHYVRGGSVQARLFVGTLERLRERGCLPSPPRIRTSRRRNDCCTIRA